MLGKEPTVILGAVSEVFRQLIPMLIIFGLIHWTDMQIAAVFAFSSAVLSALTILFTRQQTVPTGVADKQIQIATMLPPGTPIEVVKTEAANK